MFILIFLSLFVGSAQAASYDDRDVASLPWRRTTFVIMKDIQLPNNARVDLWFQNGRVSNGQNLNRDLPACTIRHYGRGKLLRTGTRYSMPDPILRGVNTFRGIPVQRSSGMVLDCSSHIEYRFGGRANHAGNPNTGALTIGQVRHALGRSISLEIASRD